jgi:hypothetical protein
MATYLTKPRPGNEVPPIDGAPYTDSQEYPTHMPVRFADARSQRVVIFELVQE